MATPSNNAADQYASLMSELFRRADLSDEEKEKKGIAQANEFFINYGSNFKNPRGELATRFRDEMRDCFGHQELINRFLDRITYGK